MSTTSVLQQQKNVFEMKNVYTHDSVMYENQNKQFKQQKKMKIRISSNFGVYISMAILWYKFE